MRLLERLRENCGGLGERPAFCGGGEAMSWAVLGAKVRATAAMLARGRGPVVVYGHKEPWMPACFLACLLAGRPYLPADRSWPHERVRRAAELAGATLLLAVEPMELPGLETWDRGSLEALPDPGTWCECMAGPAETAYIIFTSGSTGAPKGVPISRGSLDHFLTWALSLPGIAACAGRGVLNQAGYAFDLSVADLYLAVMTGGTHTALTGEEQSDFSTMFTRMWKSGAGLLVATPAFLRLCLTDASFCCGQMGNLGGVLSCGEVLRSRTAEKLFRRFPKLLLYNAYGPTEGTCAVSAARIHPEDCGSELPIGEIARCGADISIEIGGAPCPEGTVGEIVLRGAQLSPGYLNGIPGGFRDTLTGRAYGTGDLGVICAGKLWYRGRMDEQIKYRGYRVEPGEIEAALETLSGIERAAVLPRLGRDGGVQGLVAFVESPQLPDWSGVKEELEQRLPPWMCPGQYAWVEHMPLTPNGKCDRNTLKEWVRDGKPG